MLFLNEKFFFFYFCGWTRWHFRFECWWVLIINSNYWQLNYKIYFNQINNSKIECEEKKNVRKKQIRLLSFWQSLLNPHYYSAPCYTLKYLMHRPFRTCYKRSTVCERLFEELNNWPWPLISGHLNLHNSTQCRRTSGVQKGQNLKWQSQTTN